MKQILTKHPWKATVARPDTVRLHSDKPLQRRWYLLRVSADCGAPGATLILKKGYHAAGSYLPAGRRPGEWELVFFHHQSLRALQLEFPDSVAASGQIRIEIAQVATWRAVVAMMRSVSRGDRDKEIDPTRIYRKSWARWRRHGWQGFLFRLVREYQPQEVLSVAVKDPYRSWMDTVEAPEFEDRASIQASIARLPQRPLISVLLTLRNEPERLLRKTIESVLNQSYRNLELCISVHPTARNPHHVALEYAGLDARIRVSGGDGQAGAGQGAAGAYLTFVDQEDELAEHALYFLVLTLSREPGARILYSDEDCIGPDGVRFAPHFKPDWNPDLFFSHNYLRRLCAFRRDLLNEAGALEAVPGNFSPDTLPLRLLPAVGAGQIVHLPRVLYHRRVHDKEKGESQSGHNPVALRDYFSALGQAGISIEDGLAPGSCRVRFPLPSPEPLVSLLIPTRDRLELIEPCVRSILEKTSYANFEILILDNQSEDPATVGFLAGIGREDPRVRVLRYDLPFNYSAINNFGVRQARGELVGLLNNDVEVISQEWLGEMVQHALRPDIGCVGAKLYYPDGTIQHAGVILGLWGVAGHSHKYFPRSAQGYCNRLLTVQNYSAVTGACLVVRRAIYQEVGGLDETNLAISFNDVDFCLKVRQAGYRNLWTPYAELYHHESVSRGGEDTPEKKQREGREIAYMKARWGELLQADPSYNPNLTHHMENFSINLDHILYPPAAPEGSPPL